MDNLKLKEINISVPGVKVYDIEYLSKLTELISGYSSDSIEPDNETIAEILSKMTERNKVKSLEALYEAFENIIRNRRMLLYNIVICTVMELSKGTDDDPRNLNMVYGLINKLCKYIDGNMMITPQLKNLKDSLIISKDTLTPRLEKAKENNSIESIQESVNGDDIRFISVVESMLEMCQEVIEEVQLQESSLKAKARKASEKVKNKMVRFTLAEREMAAKLNDKFNRYLNEYKEYKKTATYDKIVTRSINLSKMIRTIITSSIVALLVPAGVTVSLIAGAITLLVTFAVDKRTEKRHRQVILNDLRFELRMVQEKIRDAEAAGDRKSKYKLMRLENRLGRAIDRIKFNLDN